MTVREEFNRQVPTAAPAPMPVSLIPDGWRPRRKGSLRGFASVRVGRSLILFDCPVNSANGRTWCSLPGKPKMRADGSAYLDKDGKPIWSPLGKWDDRATQDRFSEGVVAAIIQAHGTADLDDAP
jgi:hypothetical protein